MKIAYYIFFLLLILFTGLGLFVYNNAFLKIKNQGIPAIKINTNKKDEKNKGQNLLLNKNELPAVFTTSVKGSELENALLVSGGDYIENPTVNITSTDIELSGKGKKLIKVNITSNVVPHVINNQIKFEVVKTKIFGVPVNWLNKKFSNILNAHISTNINKDVNIKKVELAKNQIIISGEKK